MSKTQAISQQVKALVGTSFGHFNACDKALSNQYSIYMEGADKNGSWGRQYKDKNGNIIADVKYDTTGKEAKYTIVDHKSNLKYTSKEIANNSDKFDHIYVGDYVITDSNKNGVVDNDDAIAWVGKGPGIMTRVANFLMTYLPVQPAEGKWGINA